MSSDSFRATCYKDPSKDWSPADLIQLPWVANGGMASKILYLETSVCSLVVCTLLSSEREVQGSGARVAQVGSLIGCLSTRSLSLAIAAFLC